MQKLDSPWLLCGDFNTPAESWLDRTCSVVVRPEPAQPTYPAHQPVEAIDYFLASPGLHVTGKVLEVEGSDHLPVVVLTQLPPAS
jgi:endonuclease/exonuclease/phosphatase family metal-dependent hydrolase